MGLDTYASRSPDEIVLTEEDLQAFADAQITLCGGLFSVVDDSFRGKVYVNLILELTGENLTQYFIPLEKVHEYGKL